MRTWRVNWLTLVCAAVVSAGPLLYAADGAAITVEKDAAGMVMHHGDETVHVSVCGPTVVHIVAGPGDPKGASPFTP